MGGGYMEHNGKPGDIRDGIRILREQLPGDSHHDRLLLAAELGRQVFQLPHDVEPLLVCSLQQGGLLAPVYGLLENDWRPPGG